jgi:hypothetical protein
MIKRYNIPFQGLIRAIQASASLDTKTFLLPSCGNSAHGACTAKVDRQNEDVADDELLRYVISDLISKSELFLTGTKNK